MATHSGDLIATCPLTSLRRLRRKDGEIAVYRLEEGVLDDRELRKIENNIRSRQGSLLFARCWFLMEGEADRLVLEGCARTLGQDLMHDGVSCIEYKQIGIGSAPLIRFADAMGIEWHLVADNDQEGSGYVSSARNQISTRQEHRHISQLHHGDLEAFLCQEGYGHLYEKHIDLSKRGAITAPYGTPSYWEQIADAVSKNAKVPCAVEVVEEMEQRGPSSVPRQLREIIETVLELAKEARDG